MTQIIKTSFSDCLTTVQTSIMFSRFWFKFQIHSKNFSRNIKQQDITCFLFANISSPVYSIFYRINYPVCILKKVWHFWLFQCYTVFPVSFWKKVSLSNYFQLLFTEFTNVVGTMYLLFNKNKINWRLRSIRLVLY